MAKSRGVRTEAEMGIICNSGETGWNPLKAVGELVENEGSKDRGSSANRRGLQTQVTVEGRGNMHPGKGHSNSYSLW